jgi:hypothetical protein
MTTAPITPQSYEPQPPDRSQPRSGGGCLKALGCTAAVGCVLVGLVLVVLLGVGWWAMRSFSSRGGGLHSFENIADEGEVRRLREQAAREAPFDVAHPPRLAAERLDVYLAIRRTLRPDFERNRAIIQTAAAKMQGTGTWSLSDILEFTRVWSELKLRHAQLLVTQRMSVDEYRYISSRAFALLGPTAGVPEQSGPATTRSDLGRLDDTERALLRTRGADLDWDQGWVVEELLLTSDFGRFANLAGGSPTPGTDRSAP